MASEILINTSQIKSLAKDLRSLGGTAASDFRKGLKVAGDGVLQEARAMSSWSGKIPGAIKLATSGTTLILRASDSTGEAATFEHQGNPGSFRHPVFGNRDLWVSQDARPYLSPALEARSAEFEAQFVALLDATFARVGL